MFKYDATGKLRSSFVYDKETYIERYGTQITYDDQARVSTIRYEWAYHYTGGIGQGYASYVYVYDNETGNLKAGRFYTNDANDLLGTFNLTYDELDRLTAHETQFSSVVDLFYNRYSYTYKTNGNAQSLLIGSMTSEVKDSKSGTTISSTTYQYTYDDNGNITQIANGSGVVQHKYTYDSLGQLVREDNRPLNKSYTYSYDSAGNIRQKKTYAFSLSTLGTVQYTYTYTYGDTSWGDLLTAYDGKEIQYDAIGNPIMVYEGGGQGYNLTWEGRELISYEYVDFAYGNMVMSSYTFTYNADGIRTSKTVNGVKHTYILNGSQILADTWGSGSSEHWIVYIYDELGSPIGMKYRTGAYAENEYDIYFFERNLQGDIVAVYNESGTQIGTYTYDAWGNFSTNVASTATAFEKQVVRTYNPFRYRGYYYDVNLGMYYLQSRYYNPTWGRFLNPDGVGVLTATPEGLTDKNLFAYCDNNPIMRVDEDGEFWNFIIGGIVGAVVGGITAAISSYQSTGEVNLASTLLGVATGAVGGVIGASGLGMAGQAVASGILNAANTVGSTLIQGGEINFGEVLLDAGIGAASSLIGSVATKKLASAANEIIDKGVSRVVAGLNRYDNGERYWKGAIKRGISIIERGVRNLNYAQGKASVLGSMVGGGFTSIKLASITLWG